MNDNYSENDLELTEDEQLTGEAEAAPSEGAPAKDPDGRTEIVGIRFKKKGKTYYFAPNGFTLNEDDRVIVDTARGQEYGFTAVTNREISNREICEPLRSVLRMATQDDTRIHEENVKKEIDAFNTCIALIDKHRLEMKLIDAELSFDRSKLLFYFSAENRVDFRELVKDLAGTFHTRIEMRQIGIRDEAKILGGLGICGRPYCCNTFLSDFGQVSVKMAKEQNLSLNSAKISGSCGRLMCCLRYEYDTYLAEKALTPKVDTRVVTPNGAGVVIAANPLAGIVKVRLDANGEDSDAVAFVREDVIEESKYSGEILVKTEIREKGSRSDDIPTMTVITEAAPVEPTAEQEAPVEAQTVAPVAENNQPQGENERRRNNRHRHKKHGDKGHGNGGDTQHKDTAERNEATDPSPKNNERPEKHGGDEKRGNRHKRHGHGNGNNQNRDAQQPKQNNGDRPQQQKPAQDNNSQGADGNVQKKKKKFFKPYYKHGKGNKPQGGGDAK